VPSDPKLPLRASEASEESRSSPRAAGPKTLEPAPDLTADLGGEANRVSEPRLAQLAHIPFADPQSASEQFARVSRLVSPGLAATLPSLLSESPDPDSSLILLDRMTESSGEIVRLLDQHLFLAHYALLVFGHSRFLGEELLQNPDLLQALLRDRNLDRSFSKEEFHESLARFRSRSFETDVSYLLARFKRREYVRIMLRDVLKIAPLAETTADISALSDVLIEDALRAAESTLQQRYASPQHLDAGGRLVDTPFAVLSLGKLGGNELNYSSDVDLLYIFGDGQEPSEAQISNREYFVRLAQQVTEILSRTSREGAVFRIDLRLRPQGNEGELAISLSRALHYYAHTAHDWERQALIKVRYSAGNEALAREFIRGVQPHVYTAGINFAAIKTALVAREKMHAGRYRRRTVEPDGETIDVKIDRGGIRDIEFLVQCLQRVYGGEEPWLRSGGTLFSLQKLHDKRHISSKDFHELTIAYEFLRHLEHRLQLRQGQQTHRLPGKELELRILQRSMEGYSPGIYRLVDLPAMVRRRMDAVAAIYRRVIFQQQSHRENSSDGEFQLQPPPDASLGDQSGQQVLERLAEDAPEIYEAVVHGSWSPQARKNLFRFLGSAFSSSQRYAAVVRKAGVINRALDLFESSEYLTDILVRHPEEIATLADGEEPPQRRGGGYLFGSLVGAAGQAAGDAVFAYLAASSSSYGEKLSLLRQHYRHRVFAAGARDINECRGVYESMAVNTAAAEDAIATAFKIAGAPPGLAVMAVGRLGSGEFDVLSDADLLFVCEEGPDRLMLAKAAEKMMQVLAAYTQDGMVFSVDTRLRPRGGEGELLMTPVQLASYCEQEAQAWEALTYTKLRFLAGEEQLGRRASAAAKILFERMGADPAFLPAVREMRARIEASEAPGNSLKTSAGGLYDVDFLSGYLLVEHGMPEKAGTLRDRLWRCAEAGLLEKADAATLDHAAELLRATQHVVRLAVGRPLRWLPATEHARQVSEKLTARILERDCSEGLEAEILRTFQAVRAVYARVVGLPEIV
jgi:[glutamine synthetase] adenylyltransferase / [glutamine synthetase]-adenylyl-L-tyrosine phosphorylase